MTDNGEVPPLEVSSRSAVLITRNRDMSERMVTYRQSLKLFIEKYESRNFPGHL